MPVDTFLSFVRMLAVIASPLVLAACATYTFPVTVTTSKGEVFAGKTEGPAFSGRVMLANQSGVTCEGTYTVDQSRLISAPDVKCSDGRTTSFTARLEADLASARGSARMSDGTTAEVGVGRLAGTNRPLEAREVFRPPANYRRIVVDLIRDSYFDPYSIRDAEITPPTLVPSVGPTAWQVCIKANAKNRLGAYVGRKLTVLTISDGTVVESNGEDRSTGYRPRCANEASFGPFIELERLRDL